MQRAAHRCPALLVPLRLCSALTCKDDTPSGSDARLIGLKGLTPNTHRPLVSLQPAVSVRLVGTHEGLDVLPGTHLGDTDLWLWGTRKVGWPLLYPVPRPHNEGTEIYTCCWQYPGLSLTWRIWVVF